MPIIDDTTQSPDTAQTPDLKGEEVLKKDLEIQDGRWWRFSAYVIAEYRRPTGSGFRARFEPGPTRPTIRPAPNAVLERFDPWTPHWSTAGKRRTVHPPYADLLELARNLTFVPNHTSFTPTAESANAILEWCAKYGLLGILPARVEVITLQAFWVPRSEAWNDPEARGFCPRYVRYVRRAGQWSETGATTEIPDPPLTEEEATPERLYDAIPSLWQIVLKTSGRRRVPWFGDGNNTTGKSRTSEGLSVDIFRTCRTSCPTRTRTRGLAQKISGAVTASRLRNSRDGRFGSRKPLSP